MKTKEHKKGLIITRFPLRSAWGGEEKLHLFLADCLQKEKTKVILWSSCTPLLQAFSLKKIFQIWGMFVVDVTSLLGILVSPFSLFILFLQGTLLLPILRLKKVESLLMLTLIEKVFVTPFALLLGYKVVWAHHAPIGNWLIKNPFLFLWKLWGKKVEILVPSREMRRILLQVDSNLNIKVVHNVVPPLPKAAESKKEVFKKSLQMQPGVRIIGTASRLSPEKNLYFYLELAKKFPEDVFLIAGDGPDKKYLMKNKPKNVLLLGKLSEEGLSIFYETIDIFVSCSKYETFGLTFIEAAHARVPSIAPKVGGIPEVIQEGKTGLLYEPENLQEASNKLRLLLQEPALRSGMGNNAKQFTQNFGEEKYMEKMREVLF